MSKLNNDFQYEYKAIWRFDSFTHMWIIHGPKGSIHFHTDDSQEWTEKYGPIAGLEIHYRSPPEYMKSQAPQHPQCQILNAPCWHDGTSLYATEHLWPLVDFHNPLAFFGYLVCEMRRFDEEDETS